MLAESAYGKSRIRIVQLQRRSSLHTLCDLTVAVRFEGDYDDSYAAGDNAAVLPTDTMKNTVYALAARDGLQGPEEFGLRLARYFLDRNPPLRCVRIDLTEHAWRHITIGGREAEHAFERQGGGTRTATVEMTRERTTVGAGVSDLMILKSAHSAFAGFVRDEYTTLPETHDRLLATSMTATWRYENTETSFGPTWYAVRRTLLETFAEHDSRSVQHTLHAMGQAVLERHRDVATIHLVMPNKHHLAFDVSRFGLENRNEIFVATDEPHGLIEATLVRHGGRTP